MLFVGLTYLLTSCYGQELEYRFNENFGQIFHDYSSNGNRGVNGESNLTTLYDTIPTDRGAYFDNFGSSLVQLPPNEAVGKPFLTSSIMCIKLWILFISEEELKPFNRRIMSRIGANNSFLFELNETAIESASGFYDHAFSIRFLFPSYDSGQLTSKPSQSYQSNIYIDHWTFISYCISSESLTLFNNEIVLKQVFPSPYKDSSHPHFTLGSSSNSFIGLVFEVSVFFSLIDPFEMIGGGYSPGNCILHNCESTCRPSYYLNDRLYCLPSNLNMTQDSLGNTCKKMTGEKKQFGCIQGVDLECKCEQKSCVVRLNKTGCWCSHGAFCDCPKKSFAEWQRCFSCHKDCMTCDDSNWCNSCVDENAVPDRRTGCVCKDGYYNTTNLHQPGSCVKCKEDCAGCENGETCTKCKVLNSTVDSNGQCVCQDGFFPQDGGKVCTPCKHECSKCQIKEECLACQDPNSEVVNGKCLCNSRYFNTSALSTTGSCIFCNLDCVSCLTSGACSSCVSLNSEPAGPHEGCRCIEGYFNSSALVVSFACSPCLKACKNCINYDTCQTCKDSNAVPVQGGCACRTGFYNLTEIEFDGACIACHDDCLSCLDGVHCTQCKDFNAKPDKDRGCICEDGFVNKTALRENGVCKKCHDSCKKCDSDYNCLECHSSNSIILSPVHGCACSSGYFASGPLSSPSSCQPCGESCETCSSQSSCDSCRSQHSYPSSSSPDCSCLPGFFNLSKLTSPLSCQACHSHCKSCSSQTTCIECKAEFAVSSNIGCKCQAGHFNRSGLESSDACQACQVNCEICSSADNCSKCFDENAEVKDGLCGCKDGYFDEDEGKGLKCKRCSKDCRTCNSAARCKSCIADNANLSKDGCKCKDGYFNASALESKDRCIKCLPECFNCTSIDTCSMCVTINAYPKNDGCLCAPGYYNTSLLRSVSSCLKCNDDCLKCDNNFTCLICKSENASPHPKGGCACNEGYHNVSKLEAINSCTDLDLYSIRITSNETMATAHFPYLVTVLLINKEGKQMSGEMNVTLFSYSDDLMPNDKLTQLVTDGKAVFEVYSQVQGSNSLSVIIGPVVGILYIQVMSPQIEIISIRPMVIFK